jgi:hypothetical protein
VEENTSAAKLTLTATDLDAIAETLFSAGFGARYAHLPVWI